jgi:integrase
MGLSGPRKAFIWVHCGYTMKLTENRSLHLPLPKSGQRFTFCDQVKGFGVRCTPGARTYIVQVRYNDRKLRIKLGPVGTLPFEGPAHAPGARDLAITALTAAGRGEDPHIAIGRRRQPAGLTIAQVWAAYKAAGFPRLRGVGHKRPSTIEVDARRYRGRIEPRLGTKAISEIDTAVAQRWLDQIKSRGQRTQCLLLLKTLLSFARTRGLAVPNTIDIQSEPSRKVQTFLTPEELRALDTACVVLAAEQPARTAGFVGLRVLIHTGCRMSEVLSAQRRYFDPANATLKLPRDKASDDGREVLLSPAAVEALQSLPVTSSPFLFASHARCGHMVSLDGHAADAFARAGLKPVRIHDLRHSFASAAVGKGVPLYTVGALLGHRNAATTQRYSHLSREHKREALDLVAAAINGGGS